jgi:hypothetical protein
MTNDKYQKILLANVGNRSLLYKDGFVERDFRRRTKELLDNIETEISNLKPNILPEVISKEINGLSKIFLFGSDTPDEERNDQDTLFAGQILKRLFEKDYEGLIVEVLPLKCVVVDTNALMERYRSYLKHAIEADPDAHFVLCDAGGTAQQKASLKIVLEFMLTQDRYTTYNVLQYKERKSRIEIVHSLEYRKVISWIQVDSLANTGNYEAALQVLENNKSARRTAIFKSLQVFEYLLKNQFDKAEQEVKGMTERDFRLIPVLEAIASDSFMQKCLGNWQNFLSLDKLKRLFFFLSIAQYQGEVLRNYGLSVLYHHIFLEGFTSTSIGDFMGYDINHKKNGELNFRCLCEDIMNAKLKPPAFKDIIISNETWRNTPVLLSVLHQNSAGIMHRMVGCFMDITGFFLVRSRNGKAGIDSLRNKYAHEGRTVTAKEYESFKPEFEKWYALLGLPAKNIFVEYNEQLSKALR